MSYTGVHSLEVGTRLWSQGGHIQADRRVSGPRSSNATAGVVSADYKYPKSPKDHNIGYLGLLY